MLAFYPRTKIKWIYQLELVADQYWNLISMRVYLLVTYKYVICSWLVKLYKLYYRSRRRKGEKKAWRYACIKQLDHIRRPSDHPDGVAWNLSRRHESERKIVNANLWIWMWWIVESSCIAESTVFLMREYIYTWSGPIFWFGPVPSPAQAQKVQRH